VRQTGRTHRQPQPGNARASSSAQEGRRSSGGRGCPGGGCRGQLRPEPPNAGVSRCLRERAGGGRVRSVRRCRFVFEPRCRTGRRCAWEGYLFDLASRRLPAARWNLDGGSACCRRGGAVAGCSPFSGDRAGAWLREALLRGAEPLRGLLPEAQGKGVISAPRALTRALATICSRSRDTDRRSRRSGGELSRGNCFG